MAEKPIFYEPHPVTPRRKAVLRSAGYRIIDAIYAENPDAPDNPPDPENQIDTTKLRKSELQALLADMDLPTDGTVAELRERYDWARGVR